MHWWVISRKKASVVPGGSRRRRRLLSSIRDSAARLPATVGPLSAALAVLLAVLAAPDPAAAASRNPPWRGACPLDVALVIDLSGSMAGSVDEVRGAASDLVDALRGDDNRVAVVSFAHSAKVEVPMTGVGTDDDREDVKDAIDDLGVGDWFGGGGTNWQAGLRAAADMSPQLVVMISDGEPNDYEPPPVPGLEAAPGYAANPALGAAVTVANELRDGGVRVVAIGVGSVNTMNLARISGPVVGDDYFTTDTSGLLRELYEIASRACNIPVAALPQPLGDTFPLRQVLFGALAGLLLLVIIGMVLSRRRHGPTNRGPREPSRSRRRIPVPDLVPLPPVAPRLSAEPDPSRAGRDGRGPAHDADADADADDGDGDELSDTEVHWSPVERADVPSGAEEPDEVRWSPDGRSIPSAGPEGRGRSTAAGSEPDTDSRPAPESTQAKVRPVRRYSTEHLFDDGPPGG